MANRKFGLVTGAAAIVGLLATVSVYGGGSTAARTTYLSVNTPIALPGVALAPGTYIFELADEHLDIVRVSSRDRSLVYFTGFTELIERPAGQRADRPISFGESRVGAPRPITVWYPPNDSTGRRFIYPKRSRQLMPRSGN